MALCRHVCHFVLSVACSNARDLVNKMVIYLCGPLWSLCETPIYSIAEVC